MAVPPEPSTDTEQVFNNYLLKRMTEPQTPAETIPSHTHTHLTIKTRTRQHQIAEHLRRRPWAPSTHSPRGEQGA